jgi:pilus assembly protein CpaF
MAGFDLPVRTIREQIASAIHLMVQIARFSDGRRRIVGVTEVTGREGEVVSTQDLFEFHQEGMDEKGRVIGHLRATGIVPSFADEFALSGVSLEAMGFGVV